MSAPRPRALRILFRNDGSVDIKVGYSIPGKLPNPGTKGRERLSRQVAQDGLEKALAALIDYPLDWGGFDQGPIEVADTVILTPEKG